MIPVDGNEFSEIAKLFMLENAKAIISGLPRNNSGETTRQTESVQNFISTLKDYFEAQNITAIFAFQDESWTSEQAKDHIAVKKHLVTRQDRDSGTIDSDYDDIIYQNYHCAPFCADSDRNTDGSTEPDSDWSGFVPYLVYYVADIPTD